jgi:hypothetical protein
MSVDSSKPVHPELAELLALWYAAEAPDPETAERWLGRLSSDEGLRRQFAEEIHLAGLTRAVQGGVPRWLRIEERLGGDGETDIRPDEISALEIFEDRIMGRLDSAFLSKRSLHRIGPPPWLAAAAGLVIGLFGATVVWAFANPKAVATASRLFEIIDGGFEMGGGVIASGLPTSFGVWSGDRSEIVSDGAAAPAEGRKALRFLEAEREPALPDYGAAACDVFQFVDLRSLKSPEANDDATLELSVRFRDGRGARGKALNFFGRIILFSGDPSLIVPEWPFSQEKALGIATAHVPSEGGAPDLWHLAKAKVLMPAEADFAVVHIMVHEPMVRPGTTAVFGEQYADDVRLTLKTQPTLPVRNARP